MNIGLYVHIPFCAGKCGYCDFYSRPLATSLPEPFVETLLVELDSAISTRNVRVETIFVGGGTPTVLPTELMQRLFARMEQIVAEHVPIEFTVEANPATLTDTKARLLRDSGVTRISMGAQSFHERELKVLGRLHHPSDLAPTANVVHQMGFEHFNLDLIFGIPGQTLASWSESMGRAADLGPDHLACYGLTYEPGTDLHAQRDAGRIEPVHEDLEADMYLATLDQLAELGLTQYEISNYARPGGRCQHNLRYWHNEPSLGVGPAAASYCEGRRWRNVPDTGEYVRRIRAGEKTVIESEVLSPRRRAGETAMLMLRLNEGLGYEAFQRATGFDAQQLFADTITKYEKHGLLTADTEHMALTRKGRLIANTVIADFLAPEPT